MKKKLLIIVICALGFYTYVSAQNKVVVIPLNNAGSNIGGTDKQFQYNNQGTLAGADVYYDNTTDLVGIGVMEPTGKLEIVGGGGVNALRARSSAGGGYAAGYFDATGIGTYGIWTNSDSYVGIRAYSGSGTALEGVTDSGYAATFTGGNVGIGTTSPATMLEVSSVIRSTPTDSPGSCNSSIEGAMYYDDSLNEPCFCNGTAWQQFDGGGGC